MPLENLRSGSVAPLPVSDPPRSSQSSARPEPLCSPKARIAPAPRVWSRGPSDGQRPIDQRGIAGERAVGTDQGVGRQRLAAVACDIDLAFGDQRGCEIEHDGRGALARERRRRTAPSTAGARGPPNGATRIEPAALTKWIEIKPAAAARSAHSPTRPTWPELRSEIAERPVAFAFSTPMSTAIGAIVWPKPKRPSTTPITGVSTTRSIDWLGTRSPVRTQST